MKLILLTMSTLNLASAERMLLTQPIFAIACLIMGIIGLYVVNNVSEGGDEKTK